MKDLSHWDAASDFSATELAALIAGIDPNEPEADAHRAVPAAAKIKDAYLVALALVAGPPLTPLEFEIAWASGHFSHALASVRVQNYPFDQKEPWPGEPERIWDLTRLFQGVYGDLNRQRFTRAEVQRWLHVVEMTSFYEFEQDKPPADPARYAAQIDAQDPIAAPSSVASEVTEVQLGEKVSDAEITLVTQVLSKAAQRQARQDERLRACEDAGLVFDKYSLSRLPDGVGEVAKRLGMSRQSLTTEVKAALQRRDQKRVGGEV